MIVKLGTKPNSWIKLKDFAEGIEIDDAKEEIRGGNRISALNRFTGKQI